MNEIIVGMLFLIAYYKHIGMASEEKTLKQAVQWGGK